MRSRSQPNKKKNQQRTNSQSNCWGWGVVLSLDQSGKGTLANWLPSALNQRTDALPNACVQFDLSALKNAPDKAISDLASRVTGTSVLYQFEVVDGVTKLKSLFDRETLPLDFRRDVHVRIKYLWLDLNFVETPLFRLLTLVLFNNEVLENLVAERQTALRQREQAHKDQTKKTAVPEVGELRTDHKKIESLQDESVLQEAPLRTSESPPSVAPAAPKEPQLEKARPEKGSEIELQAVKDNVTHSAGEPSPPTVKVSTAYDPVPQNYQQGKNSSMRSSRGRQKQSPHPFLETIERLSAARSNYLERQMERSLTSEQKQIREFCESRGITSLVHFTKLTNLNSIVSKGLVARASCPKLNINFSCNDPYRLDNHTNATCLSISFPNYQMFYKYRQESNEPFAVLVIDSMALWLLDCAFCRDNAASNEERSIPIENRKGKEALERLFIDFPQPNRLRPKIPNNYPTLPQAEVLVFETVHPFLIKEIHFINEGDAHKYCKFKTDKHGRVIVNKGSPYFTYRQDYKRWQH